MATATASDPTAQAVDLLKQRKASIKDDRRELDAEERRIDRSLKALGHTTTVARRPALPAAGGTGSGATAPAPRAKRKRSGGTRRDEALGLIKAAGPDGIDASKIAKKMKIKPNYLYRVLGGLVEEKLVKKDGRVYTTA